MNYFKCLTSILLLVALSACGDTVTSGEPDTPPGNPGNGGGNGGGSGSGNNGGSVDLSGMWALQVINSQIFDGALGTDTVVITSVSKVEITQNGTELSATQETCSVDLTPYAGNATTYPQNAVSALEVKTVTATLSKTEVGATYSGAWSLQLLGWHADSDPENETLPSEPNDSRVYDADNDGNPGVSLQVQGSFVSGDIYIVNRSATELTGSIVSKDRVDGSSHTIQSQNILDASSSLLTLGSIEASPNPDSNASTFTMVRLQGGSNNCSSIVATGSSQFN